MAQPTLTFLLDDGTGTFPYNETGYVLGDAWTQTRGRDDWQGAVTAGQLDILLNNSDGRFTPGSTIIASPSPIKVDQRVRLKETINGVTYTRFTGYAKSWPVAWPATVSSFATVRLTATDAQARAERRPLRSVIDEEILADSPSAYYTLGETAGSLSAGDTSGNQAKPLGFGGSGTAVVFGGATGMTTTAQTGASFTANTGQYLAGATSVGTGSWGFGIRFSTTGNTEGLVYLASGSNAVEYAALTIDASGRVNVTVNTSSGGGVVVGPSAVVNNGFPHHAFVTYNGTNVTLYVDGISTGSPVAQTAFSAPMTKLYVGVSTTGGTPPAGGATFTGVLSGVEVYTSTAISSARALAHAQAGSTGFAGESGTARLSRLAGYAGLPVGTLDTSLTNVAFEDWTGNSLMQGIQDTADAEVGVAYFDGTGSLVFHNRNRNIVKTSPDLTLSAQYVTPDVSPVTDDQRMVNYFTGTSSGTGGTSVVVNSTSVGSHQQYPLQQTYLVQTDAEVVDRGNWIVAAFGEPSARYGTLTIRLTAMTASQASMVLNALDVDCWLRVTGAPAQNTGGTTVDVIVEGWTETVTAETWEISCNVVAASLFSAWILGDSTYGVLGSTTKLYI